MTDAVAAPRPEPVEAPWDALALVCRKCGKKLGGGFGKKAKHGLAQELRAALKQAGRRRAVRVVEVGCLGLCPKRAVAVAAEGGVVFSVPPGTDAAALVGLLCPPAAASPAGPPAATSSC